VVAVALAPFGVRQKIRQAVENVGVPLGNTTWDMIPTHPVLFAIANRVGRTWNEKRFYEGLIVTGNGVRDCLAEKDRLLQQWPGALAVEEEGHVCGVICTASRVPYLVVRGISDMSQGDKQRQPQQGVEDADQTAAAEAAAHIAVEVIRELTSTV
jgi:nucleoside phosphorylase